MLYKRYIVSILFALLAPSTLVYSAAPFGGYTPGSTNNPDCAPGDTDCFVQALVDTDAQTLLLSGSILSISNGNSIFLPMQATFELNSLTGSIQSFDVGDSGTDFAIISTGSTHTFQIPDASATARGFVNTLTQSFQGVKTFLSDIMFDGSVILGSALGDIITVNGTLKIIDGNQGSGKILTSDASGNSSWQNSSVTDNQILSLTGNSLSISNGNSLTLNYLSSYTETDPIFSSSPSFGIGTGSISNWNTAFGWGDHGTEGYLTSYTEIDPIFTASPSFGIGTGSIANWNTAFSWGNHGTQGYLTGSALSGYLTGSTTNVPEGTNLYYTNARGIGSILTGFVAGSGTVAAADSVLQAIQKLQGSNTTQDTNISSKIGLINLSATGGINYDSGLGLFSISQADTTTNGFLSNTDWNTFNNKLSTISIGTPNNGLSFSSGTLSLGLSNATTTGALSRTDWNIFNNKQNILTFGNISSSTPALSVTNGTGASVGPNVSFSIVNSGSGTTGLLSSTDWNTFNVKIGLTNLSGISPILYNNTNGQISWSGSTTNVSEGSNLYFTPARFDSSFSGKTTSNLAEGTNLYFTNARGISSLLTGFTAASGTVTASDSIIQAIQKLQGSNTIQDASIATKENILTFNSGLTRSGSTVGIAPGTNGQVLSTSGGVVTWANLGGAGISSLNSLTGSNQTFAVGTGGTNFTISSTGSVHTFSIPDASATARGFMNILAQTFEGVKTFAQAPIFSSFTPGSIPFISTGGLLSQNNTNFLWDNANQRLGIGTNIPAYSADINGTLRSNKYILGAGPDLSLIPIINGQSALTSWWGLQLVGNRQSNIDYTPTNYGTNGQYGVIIPSMQTASISVMVRAIAAQTANLLQFENSSGSGMTVVSANGSIGIGNISPNNKLEITHGTTGNSGLRFTNLVSTDTGAINNMKQLSVNGSGDVILTNDMRQRVSLGSDGTGNATTTFQTATGLTMSVTSGIRYQFECRILYNAAAANVGSRWAITGPTSTLLGYTARYTNGANAISINNASAYDIGTVSTNSAGTTGNIAEIRGIIKPSANGNVSVRFASENTGLITPKEGSTCEYWSY